MDAAAALLAPLGVGVKGVVDSGWFLDTPPFAPPPMPCADAHSCAPSEAIRRGAALWQAQIPAQCAVQFPGEEWNCFFGYKLYPTIQSKLEAIALEVRGT